MTILDKINEDKRILVASQKQEISISELEKSSFFAQPVNSLSLSLIQPQSSGIIAEFKRKSPSKGIINDQVLVEEVTHSYVQNGAAGLSVLTDNPYFGGSFEDFEKARRANPGIPMLRKDFMVDEYQIIQAKSMGADVILLIAASLNPKEIKIFSELARSLGMEVLLEVHDKEELERSLMDSITIVGVNNRNLKNFAEQNVEASKELSELIPDKFIKISESCISGKEIIKELRGYNYTGFLVGESFMKTSNPGKALKEFIS
ncbi:MAG: Indole-3-glycerol-phosphate synthase [Bacteroidota bacterium]|jgi:indole-3-glycerol phosphate synthase